MGALQNMAKRVSSDLPLELEPSDNRGIMDVITIIMQILTSLGPLLDNCKQAQPGQFGESIVDEARNLKSNPRRNRFRRLRFRRLVRRATDHEERDALGGTTAITNSFIDNALEMGPAGVQEAFEETKEINGF